MADSGSEPSAAASDARAVDDVRALAARTAASLTADGARDEALADFVPARRVLGFQRQPAMAPRGRVWRLGVFLLSADGSLHATGAITRAVEPGHPGHVAVSSEERRAQRAAAFRGPFERGETVNFGTAPIELSPEALRDADGPLFVRGGRALVRWNAALDDDAAADFATYLAERADLLLHPPEGA